MRAGFANLLEDLKRGRISITDESAFEVGRNVAVSKGSVVFENELFQLIQYAPLTEKVAERPLVIVPPCINKFYILDLQPENSFVRFACEQGQTVFLVSWRNPDAELGHITWDDYVENGAIKAIEVGRAISGADKVNAVGWCVGGTILSSALAVLRARGDDSVASLTLLTTMLDFSDPGDLGVFIDEQGVSQREQTIGKGGIYSGGELGFVFQTLRANDLIWPYVVNNYLKGGAPQAFDLLYWNADGTNLPGPMYAWYLRNMYLENNLCKAGRLSMCGTPVDLGKIDMPSYIFGTQEDHIVPWKGAYRSTQTRRRRHAVRARRERPYRGRDQSGVEEQAQLLDRRHARRRSGCVARIGEVAAGKLVDALEQLAAGACGQAGRGAEEAGQREVQADRTGAGALCGQTSAGSHGRLSGVERFKPKRRTSKSATRHALRPTAS